MTTDANIDGMTPAELRKHDELRADDNEAKAAIFEDLTPEQIEKIKKQGPGSIIAGMDRAGEPDETMITIHLPKRKAESLSLGLSDLLCWTQGFNAALTELDSRSGPMGTESARELNIALKDALSRADRGL